MTIADNTVMSNQLTNILRDERVQFVAVPTPALRELISRNEHPYIKEMPNINKLAFLQAGDGKAVPIDRKLIISYVEGSLDERQKFILDRCDIRVIGDWQVVASAHKQ